MEVIILILGMAFGLIPALLARRTGRNFWLWWLYGFAVWPVAMIHVVAAKPPEQGGTGTLGKALATILGIPIGGFTLLFIIFLSIPEETKDRMVGEPVKVTQEKNRQPKQKAAVQSATRQDERQESISMPNYQIEEERDVSHGAASRITFWARLVDEEVSKDGIRLLIKDVVDRNRKRYDIIWVEVVPLEGRPRGEGFYGWVPVICSAKWISPDLDEVYHTTISGPNSGENLDGIVVAWSLDQGNSKGQHSAPDNPLEDELPANMCGVTEAQRQAIWEERVRIERQARWYSDSVSPIIIKGQVLNFKDDAESIGKNAEVFERRIQELETILTEQYKLTSDQLDSISVESIVRFWPLPPVEQPPPPPIISAKVVSEPPFDPSAVIVRLQHPLFYAEAADLQWKRNVLSDGEERWVGTVDSLLIFAITSDWLYVMGSIANTALTSNTLLAFYELNSIAMPDNYEKVNNEILPGMIDEAALETNPTQSRREFAGWLLELEGLQAITSISYKISRSPER